MTQEKSLSTLSKHCSKNEHLYVKKSLLVGYTSDLLKSYINDYIVSIAHTDKKEISEVVNRMIVEYKRISNNDYVVIEITYTVLNHTLWSSTLNNACTYTIKSFLDYDDAFEHIKTNITNPDIKANTKRMYVMVKKLDERVCEGIHAFIHNLTTSDSIKFKPSKFNVRLWVHVNEFTHDDVYDHITKLEKHNTNERWVKAKYNQPSAKSMMITVNDYRLLTKLKLTSPWVFANLYKVHYGMNAITQKIKETECL